MANATITGNGGINAVTLNNATNGSGVPSQNQNDVTVVTSAATVSGFGAFYDVSFQGGADYLTAQNMPWVNPDSGDSVGFDQINMGADNDTVALDRSGFLDIDMGTGNDVLELTNSGGQTADMGSGDDFTRLDLSNATGASEEELAQKDGQPLTDLDGGADDDTLRLVGDWTVTLSSGNATIDPDNDGLDTTVTNVFTSADFADITGFPPLLNGSVQWSDPVTLPGGEVAHPAIEFSNYETLEAVCFTGGTMIDTPDGPRDVANLREGDLVTTRKGAMPVRWIGKRRLDTVDLMANPKLLPVRVPAGAIDVDKPAQDVLFSPQHRILVRSGIAREMFGADEVLVAAKQLVGYGRIDVDGETRTVTYYHILLDTHEIVFAEGLEAETMLPGPQALKMLPDSALEELLNIFPNLMADAETAKQNVAAPIPKGRDCRALVARMRQGYTTSCRAQIPPANDSGNVAPNLGNRN